MMGKNDPVSVVYISLDLCLVVFIKQLFFMMRWVVITEKMKGNTVLLNLRGTMSATDH